jgi:hypothetical protein
MDDHVKSLVSNEWVVAAPAGSTLSHGICISSEGERAAMLELVTNGAEVSNQHRLFTGRLCQELSRMMPSRQDLLRENSLFGLERRLGAAADGFT